MKVEEVLQNIGLGEKEAKIYLACLQLGQTTVSNIAKKARVKRPTAYVVLQDLAEQGMASIKQTDKMIFYGPTHPKKLLTQLNQKKQLLDNSFPEIMAVYNNRPQKPLVQIFEGTEGMHQVYEEILEFLKKGKEVIFYGSVDHFVPNDTLTKMWLKESCNKRYKIRELIYHSGENTKWYYEKQNKNPNPKHELRFLMKQKIEILNDNSVFGNKLVIFSTQQDEHFALVIESEVIANSYRAMFEFAWDVSKDNKLL